MRLRLLMFAALAHGPAAPPDADLRSVRCRAEVPGRIGGQSQHGPLVMGATTYARVVLDPGLRAYVDAAGVTHLAPRRR